MRLNELRTKKLFGESKPKVLILGFTYKENCVDIRNTKVMDLIKELTSNNIICDVIDPWVDIEEVYELYKLNILPNINFKNKYSAVLVTVGHKQFSKLKKRDWESLIVKNGIFYDLKNVIPRSLNPIRI